MTIDPSSSRNINDSEETSLRASPVNRINLSQAFSATVGQYNLNRSVLAKSAGVSDAIISQITGGALSTWDTWEKVISALFRTDANASRFFWGQLDASTRKALRKYSQDKSLIDYIALRDAEAVEVAESTTQTVKELFRSCEPSMIPGIIRTLQEDLPTVCNDSQLEDASKKNTITSPGNAYHGIFGGDIKTVIFIQVNNPSSDLNLSELAQAVANSTMTTREPEVPHTQHKDDEEKHFSSNNGLEEKSMMAVDLNAHPLSSSPQKSGMKRVGTRNGIKS